MLQKRSLTKRSIASVRLTHPYKKLPSKFGYALLILLAIGLITANKFGFLPLQQLRTFVVEISAPLISALSKPVDSAHDITAELKDLAQLRQENARLLEENEKLKQWRHSALWLRSENASLKELLKFVPDGSVKYITAHVIANAGGAFVRNVLISAGKKNGVQRGLAAMTGQSLIGRVSEVGESYSRVLLVTDLNSRIPVFVGKDRHRAIMAGDNTDLPRLSHVTVQDEILLGDLVVTSGHGGVFPPGLPIGVISSVTEKSIRVHLLSDPNRFDYIRLIDYGLCGIIPLPEDPYTMGNCL